MKNMKWLLFLLLGSLGSVSAQSLNDYKYVQVPVKYEFLSEVNEYQLNALTAFLFKKNGFKVLYEEEVPDKVDFCNVLIAKVEDDSGLFTTKLQVKLENCKGETVFASEFGESREKDYKKAYHEALRDAFTYLEKEQYSYSGVEGVTEKVAVEDVKVVVSSVEPAAEKLIAEKALPKVVAVQELDGISKFRNGTIEYTLKRTPAGYVLYKGTEESQEFASLLKSGGGTNYIYSSNLIKGNAYFDPTGNLVVEYIDAATGQLVSIQYKLQD